MKVSPTLSGERPVLKLMFAALVRGFERGRKLKVTEFELRQLTHLRAELKNKSRQEHTAPVKRNKTDSTPKKIYSSERT